MFDYENVLNNENFDNMFIEIIQVDKTISLTGNEQGLLYLVSRILKYVEENSPNTYSDDLKLDSGVDLTANSLSLSVFLSEKEDMPTEISDEMIRKAEDFKDAVKKRNYK